MPANELKALIKLLRSQGVVSYEANGVKLLLDPNHQAPKRRTVPHSKQKNRSVNNELQEQVDGLMPQLSEEEWLLATNNMSLDEAN